MAPPARDGDTPKSKHIHVMALRTANPWLDHRHEPRPSEYRRSAPREILPAYCRCCQAAHREARTQIAKTTPCKVERASFFETPFPTGRSSRARSFQAGSRSTRVQTE